MADLVSSMKKAAIEAVGASKPMAIVFGVVAGVSPIKINVEQKMQLGTAQLVLSKNVTDHSIEITVDGTRKTITFHKGLAVGDKVILVREQGGQRFIVLDRVA